MPRKTPNNRIQMTNNSGPTIHVKETPVRPQITTDDIGSLSPVEASIGVDADLDQLSMVVDDTLESPAVSALVRELAFNEEGLDFVVAQTSDKNAENPVISGVNGEIKRFYRGQIYKDIPRKFVVSLIKSETSVTTKNYTDGDGLHQTNVVKTPSIKTGVQILRDPSPHKNAWFEWLLRTAS